MTLRSNSSLVAGLGWDELSEHTWAELIEAGFPPELAHLGCDLARRTGRPLRVFTMPIMRVGIVGLALPFVDDDGIVFDQLLLDRPDELSGLVSHELAHILFPGWRELHPDRPDDMENFASILAPSLLRRLPSNVDEVQPMIDRAMDRIRAA
jgi:hypothetical protein